jgi:hypothetical protein
MGKLATNPRGHLANIIRSPRSVAATAADPKNHGARLRPQGMNKTRRLCDAFERRVPIVAAT